MIRVDLEELKKQIATIEKLLDNPSAMACLREDEINSIETGLLNLLGEIRDKTEDD